MENISLSCSPSDICATSCLSKRTRSCIHKNKNRINRGFLYIYVLVLLQKLNLTSRKLGYSQDDKESTEYRDTLRKKALTCSVRKTDLHPLDRCDEADEA
ncbi:hypothetical protein AB4114_30225 [Paenibacillus sp. 2RAB27]